MKIHILDHTYNYKIVKDDCDGKWGRSNAKEGWLIVSNKCPKDQQASTLLHEVVHIASDLLDAGLHDQENKVSAIAMGLHSFIKSNPKLIKKMLK